MEKLLLLTNIKGQKIIIGVESIIACTPIKIDGILSTKIESRGAMIETNFVIESIEEIYKIYKSNSKTKK